MDGIAIKGVGDSLLVTLGEGKLTELLTELDNWLEETPFFAGGEVTLQVGARGLSVYEIEGIRSLLAQREVSLRAVISESVRTRVAARNLGLGISLRPQGRPGPSLEEETSQGVLLHGTLRSGQAVYNPGHVVIVGDVNPGAEVVAGGDVLVWGKLRGTVHAGARGDERAVVCALQMLPTQLRIADYIARPPEGQSKGPIEPEVASVRGGWIVVETWLSAKIES